MKYSGSRTVSDSQNLLYKVSLGIDFFLFLNPNKFCSGYKTVVIVDNYKFIVCRKKGLRVSVLDTGYCTPQKQRISQIHNKVESTINHAYNKR